MNQNLMFVQYRNYADESIGAAFLMLRIQGITGALQDISNNPSALNKPVTSLTPEPSKNYL
jgi:hypothetical protein